MNLKESNENIRKELYNLTQEKLLYYNEIELIDDKIKKVKSFCPHSETSLKDSTGDIICDTCLSVIKQGDKT